MSKNQNHPDKKGGGQGSKRPSEVPMKIRRRQSDARWRANVASCYETLKHVIPINIRASKRQLSKALILQETSKHVTFLEDILSKLLYEKAQFDKLTNIDDWCNQQVGRVKFEFIEKQREKIEALNFERRYKRNRYKLFFTDNLAHNNVNREPHPYQPVRRRNLPKAAKSGQDVQLVPELPRQLEVESARNLLQQKLLEEKLQQMDDEVPSCDLSASKLVLSLAKVFAGEKQAWVDSAISKQTKDDPQECSSQKRSYLQPAATKTDNDFDSVVPIFMPKKCQQEGSVCSGFTPIKLPPDWQLQTPVKSPYSIGRDLSILDTPNSQRTESAYEGEDEAESLLCSERMWQSDEEEEEPDQSHKNEHTPNFRANQHRKQVRAEDLAAYTRKRRRNRCASDCSEACVPIMGLDQSESSEEMERRKGRHFSPSCRRSLDQALDLPVFSQPPTPRMFEPDLSCNESSSPIDSSLDPTKFSDLGLRPLDHYSALAPSYSSLDPTQLSELGLRPLDNYSAPAPSYSSLDPTQLSELGLRPLDHYLAPAPSYSSLDPTKLTKMGLRPAPAERLDRKAGLPKVMDPTKLSESGIEPLDHYPAPAERLDMKAGLPKVMDGQQVLSDQQASTFDGYLLFYRRMIAEIEQQVLGREADLETVSSLIYQMWKEMTASQRQMMVEMAGMEQENRLLECTSPQKRGLSMLQVSLQGNNTPPYTSGDSILSEDLREVDVSPIVACSENETLDSLWPLHSDLDLNATDEQDFLDYTANSTEKEQVHFYEAPPQTKEYNLGSLISPLTPELDTVVVPQTPPRPDTAGNTLTQEENAHSYNGGSEPPFSSPCPRSQESFIGQFSPLFGSGASILLEL